MLVSVSRSSSLQCSRGIANGTLSSLMPKASTGSPSQIEIARNDSGGKPVTPSFMIGQLMPQISVRAVSSASCSRESVGMGADCGP